MNKLPYFDEIDFNALEDYYEKEIELDGQTISLDLNLDDGPDETWREDFTTYVANLSKYHQEIRNIIKSYYYEEGLIKEFFNYHLEELDEDMQELLANTDKKLSKEDRVLSTLQLIRIGFYFHEDNFAIWDFMIGDFSDQILVFITDVNGEVIDFTWES